jgi:hypothetical protein
MSEVRKTLTIFLYFLIQLVTRGGDWAIQNYLIYVQNFWALPAQAAGALFNISLGYLFQKMLFRSSNSGIRKPLETLAVLRAVYGVGIFLTLNILFLIWPEQYIIYSGIATLIMWGVTYKPQRDVYQATLRDLPRIVRHTRTVVLRPKNTALRIVRTAKLMVWVFKNQRVRA